MIAWASNSDTWFVASGSIATDGTHVITPILPFPPPPPPSRREAHRRRCRGAFPGRPDDLRPAGWTHRPDPPPPRARSNC